MSNPTSKTEETTRHNCTITDGPGMIVWFYNARSGSLHGLISYTSIQAYLLFDSSFEENIQVYSSFTKLVIQLVYYYFLNTLF